MVLVLLSLRTPVTTREILEIQPGAIIIEICSVHLLVFCKCVCTVRKRIIIRTAWFLKWRGTRLVVQLFLWEIHQSMGRNDCINSANNTRHSYSFMILYTFLFLCRTSDVCDIFVKQQKNKMFRITTSVRLQRTCSIMTIPDMYLYIVIYNYCAIWSILGWSSKRGIWEQQLSGFSQNPLNFSLNGQFYFCHCWIRMNQANTGSTLCPGRHFEIKIATTIIRSTNHAHGSDYLLFFG